MRGRTATARRTPARARVPWRAARVRRSPTSAGSQRAPLSTCGPCCQPSATEIMPPSTSNTRPVTSRDVGAAEPHDERRDVRGIVDVEARFGRLHAVAEHFLGHARAGRRARSRWRSRRSGPSRPTSTSVSAAMPPLAAEYAPWPTLPINPAPDDVLMMRASTAAPAFDCAAPVLGRVPRRREVSLQVHADHRVPLLFARREQHAVADEARVVDEHVEAAERVDRGLHEPAAPLQSAMSSVFATASPPAATISSTTSCAGPGRRSPVPSRATPRSLTTTRAPFGCERRARAHARYPGPRRSR